MCADRREYQHTTVHAPYIDFRPGSDVGVSTLEGSRSAAGAVSTWLTSRVIGFDRPGYGRILERTVLAARKIALGLMDAHPWIRVNQAGDTNIVTFCVAKDGEKVSETNYRALEIFKSYASTRNTDDNSISVRKINRNTVVNRSKKVSDKSTEVGGNDRNSGASIERPSPDKRYFISKTTLSLESYSRLLEPYSTTWQAEWDTDELVLIRLVLLNPFLDTKESNIGYIEGFINDLVGVIEWM